MYNDNDVYSIDYSAIVALGLGRHSSAVDTVLKLKRVGKAELLVGSFGAVSPEAWVWSGAPCGYRGRTPWKTLENRTPNVV